MLFLDKKSQRYYQRYPTTRIKGHWKKLSNKDIYIKPHKRIIAGKTSQKTNHLEPEMVPLECIFR
jgi:hypothetical protein